MKCVYFVNAGAGWCRAKKQLGEHSLHCQKQGKDYQECQDRYSPEWDKHLSKFKVNGVFLPEGSFLTCPNCAESRDLFESKNPKCPVCELPYIVSTPLCYDDSGKPYTLKLSALKNKILEITTRKL